MSKLNENTTNLQDILNTVNSLPSAGKLQVASGSFKNDDYKLTTLSITGLSFKPANVIVEARTGPSIPAGWYNVATIVIGDTLNSYSAYYPSDIANHPAILGKATSYVSIVFNDDGFDLTLRSHHFGQTTYYWTAIGT